MSVTIRAFAADDIGPVAALEAVTFPDPWTPSMFAAELAESSRAWLVAVDEAGGVVGYGGVAVLADHDAHIMNLAVTPASRRQGLGRRLLGELLSASARLGAQRVTLEVRAENAGAIALYEAVGLESVGVRPAYYGPGHDAVIMWGDLPGAEKPVVAEKSDELILAIESSCDETAAAVMRGGSVLLANVVASQIDFHARFGGVVPEIASRKHTEAIVGVIDEAMEQAGAALGLDGPLPFAASTR